MATLEEFMSTYQAFYGKFPLELNRESDREALGVWRKWIATLTPERLENVFKVLNDYRAKEGIRMRPLLEAFQRVQSAIAAGGDLKSKELRKAEEKMKIPLFDFGKEGFPRQREAFLVELPRKTIKQISESWKQLTGRTITPKDFKKRLITEGWYLPEWSDYEPEEQERLCRTWKVRNPDEVPF